jgi:hypothetical protein
MASSRPARALLGALLLLSGCAYEDSRLGAAAPQAEAAPILKLEQLRAEERRLAGNRARREAALDQTRQAIGEDRERYAGLVAALQSGLAESATPGNPQLLSQMSRAQSALDRIGEGAIRLGMVADEAGGDQKSAGQLLNATRAAEAQRASDADRRPFVEVEGDAGETLSRLIGIIAAARKEKAAADSYVAAERASMGRLAEAMDKVQKPLLTIRFDRPGVAYEDALYTAVSKALAKKPSVQFALVAVAPDGATPEQVAAATEGSKEVAGKVMGTLTQMGLPTDRVTLSATTSPDVKDSEVRLYVR